MTHVELLQYTHAVTFACICIEHMQCIELTSCAAVQAGPLLEGGPMTEHTPELRVTALVKSGLVSLSHFSVQGEYCTHACVLQEHASRSMQVWHQQALVVS